jgi:hypothetical protein
VGDSFGLFAGATGSKQNLSEFYIFSRGADGWNTVANQDVPVGKLTYSGDAGEVPLVTEAGASLLYLRPASASIYETNIYLRDNEGYAEVGPRLPAYAVPSGPINEREQANEGGEFLGSTPDLSHVLFTIEPLAVGQTSLPPGVNTDLWPGDTTLLQSQGESESLYEYVGVHNVAPELVGLNDSRRLISNCGTYPGGAEGEHVGAAGNHHNAISIDGETVFFTAKGCGSGPNGPAVNELFARLSRSHTVALSEPQSLGVVANNACSSKECIEHTSLANEGADFRAANFEGASTDGSKVYFTSAQQLVNQAVQDPAEGSNLYEYNFTMPEGERLSLVSGGDTSGLGPDVQGVAMVSEDGSHVYFVSKGILTREPRGGGCLRELTVTQTSEEEASKEGLCRAKEGADNLYVYDAGNADVAFIASLRQTDAGQWKADGRKEAIDVTNNGMFAVFSSSAHLTASDTATVQQVFRYDASTGELARVSVGEDGFNDDGNVSVGTTEYPRGEGEGAGIEEIAFDLHPAVSENGLVVFLSTDALVPGAMEHQCFASEEGRCYEEAQNVYEYSQGQVYLISSGGPNTGIFEGKAGISNSGADIYLQSTERLATSDSDSLSDVYDARREGGFASAPPASPCGGSCMEEPVVAPAAASPGSVTFVGPANPLALPTPPALGLVKRGKPLSVPIRLMQALKRCKKAGRVGAAKRKRCETAARRRYGAVLKAARARRATFTVR